MLSFLIRLSIKHAGSVVAITLLLLIYGIYRFSNAGLDIFPEFSPKQVVIQTEAPALSPEQVEILVTQPIETNINGLIGLTSVRSESIQGLSIVTATFEETSDIYRNRQLINERLANLANILPAGVSQPSAVPLSSSSATVMTIGLTSNIKNLMDLRSFVDWTLAPRLLSIPGVADVNIFGGEVKQLQIQINPQQLRRYQLSIDDIVNAAQQTGNSRGIGIIETINQRFTLQVSGQPNSPEQLKKIIVKRQSGTHITLGDVATIAYAPDTAFGAAQIMGQPGIVIMIIGQYDANTLTISKRIEETLEALKPVFEQENIYFYPHLFKPADYIEQSISNLSNHLLIGGFFVIVILYAFLFNFRTAFISATAIPVSLISAVIVLLENDVNLNIMVLGGLAIALGEVVDDAIIDTENIFRRLRQNHSSQTPKPIATVVYEASMEVRSSVVYASFIVALAFVPLLTLSGVTGRLFSPLAISYILAILMSLMVALTLTPALCYLLLNQPKQKTIQKNLEPPLIEWIKPKYIALLTWVHQNFKKMGLICLSIFLVGFLGSINLQHEFLPKLREGHYIIHTTMMPGTSLKESIRIGQQITDRFLQLPEIESVSQWAGRAERGADTYGSHYSEYEIRLHPSTGTEQQQVLDKLTEILDHFPGVVYEANTFLTERIDETISGYTSPVVINLYGDDLNLLDQKAQQIAVIMQKIPGADDIQVRSPPGTPIVQINLDLNKLQYWGLTPESAMNTIKVAYSSLVTGKHIQQNRLYDIAIALSSEIRQQPSMIGELPIRTLDGTLIPLRQIADIKHFEGRYNILHQNAMRKQSITCQVEDRDMNEFIQQLKETVLNNVSFSAQNYPEFTGAAIEQANAKKDLMVLSIIAGCGMLILIFLAMGNIHHVSLTLINIPFSLIGGLLAVITTSATLSVGSMVGFITLFGITVRNTIMLLSHYQQLVSTENQPWNLSTAIRGAHERLPSILMTALVTALAMLPIAINSDNPGKEIMGPMATIIIGGLASSTILNLILMPMVLLRFGKFEQSNPNRSFD